MYFNNKTNGNNIFNILIICLFVISTTTAQVNKTGLTPNRSKGGSSYSETFHAISIQTAFDIENMPFFGIGYTCMQVSRRDNDFIQENISYNLGYHLKQSIISHNIILSLHSNHIANLNLNPFIYGIAFQFIVAPDLDEIYDNFRTNEYPGQLMSNLYIRPEIGLSLPLKYNKKIASCLITYGYNFQTFWKREEIKKYKADLETQNITDTDLMPYTSINHHMVSIKLNLRFIPKKSRAYFK